MKKIEKISAAENYTAINVGKLSEVSDYVLQLAPEVKIPGKVFGGVATAATGAEFSLQVFQPGSETGFLHTHKRHEELYFFLGGTGEMQIDGTIIPLKEGSVVRVAPAGRRAVRNNGTEPLVMLCVQYQANTFTDADTVAADGTILPDPVQWCLVLKKVDS